MHTKKHNGISFQCVISVSTDLTIWFWTMKEIQVCENVFSTSSLVPVQNQNVFLSLVQIMYNVCYLKREKVWLAIIKKLNTFFFVNSWNYCLAHHMLSPIFSTNYIFYQYFSVLKNQKRKRTFYWSKKAFFSILKIKTNIR